MDQILFQYNVETLPLYRIQYNSYIKVERSFQILFKLFSDKLLEVVFSSRTHESSLTFLNNLYLGHNHKEAQNLTPSKRNPWNISFQKFYQHYTFISDIRVSYRQWYLKNVQARLRHSFIEWAENNEYNRSRLPFYFNDSQLILSNNTYIRIDITSWENNYFNFLRRKSNALRYCTRTNCLWLFSSTNFILVIIHDSIVQHMNSLKTSNWKWSHCWYIETNK